MRTLLVGLALVGVYVAYSRLTSPLLNVERSTSQSFRPRAEREKSTVMSDLSAQWFPEDQWVKNAGGRFRDGNRLLLFQDHELFNDNRSIRVSPVALMWQQDKDQQPITATAASAQLDASTKFSFEEGQFGKITTGLLAGVVRITGPDGLRIEGRTFSISDDAMKVWTNQPVKFRFGTHSGVASGGAEIELLASGDPESQGLMSVSDVQRIRLQGRVTCDLFFPEDASRREALRLNVSAANGFDYFVATREATFYGFMDRPLKDDNQVLITRPATNGGEDRLFCSKLVLQLQPVIENGKAAESGNLELAGIIAEGSRVILSSGEYNVIATMNRLKYRIADRRLELTGGTARGTGVTRNVECHSSGRRLSSPIVSIEHDEANQVRMIECHGAGRVDESPHKTDAPVRDPISASWTESLVMQRGERPTVTMRGDASLHQEATSLKLQGDELKLTLRPTVASSVAGSSSNLFDSENLKPELLTGTGNVHVESSGVVADARESLTVTFMDAALANAHDDRSVRTVSATSEAAESGAVAASRDASLGTGLTTCESDTIEVTASLNDTNQQSSTQLSNLWLKGAVVVSHTGATEDESFEAEGNALFAREGFQGSREISLFGDPAVVKTDGRRAEMKRIDLLEARRSLRTQRDVKGEGSGCIRFVIETGPDGQLLDSPSPLDIYWSESMAFAGRTATFVGSIRAVMNNKVDHDVEITCASLKVHFADPLQIRRDEATGEFTSNSLSGESESSAGRIERIEFLGRVVVDIDVMRGGEITARHHAEFSDLEFNQQTGDFEANGPGLIESRQPDTGRQLTTRSRAVARANTPVSAVEEGFVYLKATFIGRMNGNRHDGFAQLRQHVRGVFGPVRSLDERLEIDGLNADQLPEKTGLLGCENLTIATIPVSGPSEQSFSLVAESNGVDVAGGTRAPCRLESHQFSGDADKITYDHAKQQFIVSASSGRQARVTHRPDRGEPQNLVGRTFQYNRERNQLTANQITGVQASQVD